MKRTLKAKSLWIAVVGLALLVLPFVIEKGFSTYYLYLTIKAMVWALFAVSFNPALGAAIMVFLNSFITSYTEYWGMFLGITLILIVLFFPRGVGGLMVEQFQRWGRKERS